MRGQLRSGIRHARSTGALREGMIVLADKGLASRAIERYAADQAGALAALAVDQIGLNVYT